MREKETFEKVDANDGTELIEILDKLLLLKKDKHETSFLRKTIYIVAAISAIIFITLISLSIYKNNFSTESILSTLLAFFSIFMSVFFYFKAEETSSQFYDSSYKFMKDISVTLGKIEERFGEKLNSLSEKVSHLDRESKQVSEEIEGKQEDKDRIINELLEKANLNAEEKASYRKQLEDKDAEIAELQAQRIRAEREAAMLRRKIQKYPDNVDEISIDTDNRVCASMRISPRLIQSIIDQGEIPTSLSPRTKKMLRSTGCIDIDGKINTERLYALRNSTLGK